MGSIILSSCSYSVHPITGIIFVLSIYHPLQLAVSDAFTVKQDQPKKQRMISEAEKDKLDQRRSAKKEEDMIIKYQLDTLKQERMQQAEAR